MGNLSSRKKGYFWEELSSVFHTGRAPAICSGTFTSDNPLRKLFPDIPLNTQFEDIPYCLNDTVILLNDCNVLERIIMHVADHANKTYEANHSNFIRDRQLLLNLRVHQGYFNKYLSQYPAKYGYINHSAPYMTRDIAATTATFFDVDNSLYKQYFRDNNIMPYSGALTITEFNHIGKTNTENKISLGIEGTYYLAPDQLQKSTKSVYICLYLSLFSNNDYPSLHSDLITMAFHLGYDLKIHDDQYVSLTRRRSKHSIIARKPLASNIPIANRYLMTAVYLTPNTVFGSKHIVDQYSYNSLCPMISEHLQDLIGEVISPDTPNTVQGLLESKNPKIQEAIDTILTLCSDLIHAPQANWYRLTCFMFAKEHIYVRSVQPTLHKVYVISIILQQFNRLNISIEYTGWLISFEHNAIKFPELPPAVILILCSEFIKAGDLTFELSPSTPAFLRQIK